MPCAPSSLACKKSGIKKAAGLFVHFKDIDFYET